MLSSMRSWGTVSPATIPQGIPLLDKYLVGQDERSLNEAKMKREGRLPPGLTLKWPVLPEGDVAAFEPGTWDFRLGGRVKTPLELGYEAFRALPRNECPRTSTASRGGGAFQEEQFS